MDHLGCFNDLKMLYKEEIDYQVTPLNRGGRILILAPHGGGIERGTSELVRGIAGDVFSYYIFEGLMPSNNILLHITSSYFGEPRAIEMVSNVETVLTIHGCYGREPAIYIGGTDRSLKERLYCALESEQYSVLLPMKGKYAG